MEHEVGVTGRKGRIADMTGEGTGRDRPRCGIRRGVIPAERPAPTSPDEPVEVLVLVALPEEFGELLASIGDFTVVRDEHDRVYRFRRAGPVGQPHYECAAMLIGSMGPTAGAITAQRALASLRPATVVLIGIAAGIDADVRVGDVIVADVVDAYLEHAKATPNADGGFELRLAGEPYRTSAALRTAVQHFEFEHAGLWREWRDAGHAALPDAVQQDPRVGELVADLPALHVGHLASGPVVGAAAAFTELLKRRDRKYLGLEMEAAGLLVAVHRPGVHAESLVIRGVSDLGDERKRCLDAVGAGSLRRLAMGNAQRALWALLAAGALARDPTRAPSSPPEGMCQGDTLRRYISNIPTPPPNFVGRERELADISAALTLGGTAALVQAITGLGGVGKTRLALAYAHHHARDYEVRWWLRAASLEQDLIDLGRELGVVSRPDDIEHSTVETLAWLRDHRRWLLVVDNADEPALIQGRLPLPAAGHIIITSRARAWRGVATAVEIQTLPRETSIDLLLRRSGSADGSHADAVAQILGDLPLALVQAAAFIEQTGCTFDEYRQRLGDGGLDLLRSDLGKTGDYYQETVATTWKLNFAAVRLEYPAAADLLDFLAFLDPDGVPLALLGAQATCLPATVAALVARPQDLDKALALLRRFSLIDREGGTVRVHRLVQAVAREALDTDSRHVLAAAVVTWAQAVFAYDPNDPDVGRIPARIAEQILAVGELQECIDGAGLSLARVLRHLSHYLLLAGQTHRALVAGTRALAAAEAHALADPASPAQHGLCISLSMLGDVEMQAGNLAAARTHFKRGLNVAEEQAATDPTSTAAQHDLSFSLGRLGDLEMQAGNLDAARARFNHGFRLGEALVAANPSSALAQSYLDGFLDRLGYVEMQAGNHAVARSHFNRVFTKKETLVAANPTNTMAQLNLSNSLNRLGDVEMRAGILASARGHFERGHKIREALAAADPTNTSAQRDISISLERLGYLEMKAGNLTAARAHIDRGLKVSEALAAADPKSAQASFDLVVFHARRMELAKLEQDWSTRILHLEAARARVGQMAQACHVDGYEQRTDLQAFLDNVAVSLPAASSSAEVNLWKTLVVWSLLLLILIWFILG